MTLAKVALFVTLLAALSSVPSREAPPASSPVEIDRHALVTRHNPVLRRMDAESPLSVGNGGFAFTADVTGLQTFAEEYERTIPLATMSDWGWHTFPNPEGWSIEKFGFTEFESHGRRVGYADIPGDTRTPEVQWLRSNPHRLHLGRIAFDLRRRDGSRASAADLSAMEQTLDLWNGILVSRFSLDGEAVEVLTVCHPQQDAIAARVRSALLRDGRIGIELRFPYGTGGTTAADWTKPDAHDTRISRAGANSASLSRRLDNDRYSVSLAWGPSGSMNEIARHQFRVQPASGGDTFEFVMEFLPPPVTELPKNDVVAAALPSFDMTQREARAYWNHFWTEGGAIELSESRDPRWRELERRIVLSQYLTSIQCAGDTPPQESGLTFNSWEGKFHLEMHWWHAAHFALWDRLPLLERSLGFYRRILPRARATAARQGYRGARWPKMTDPDGAESPSTVGPFLVWQQPHPIFYAELVYRQRPTAATLQLFREVVHETATFMASYATLDASRQRYTLGPPLQCAQEVFPKGTTVDCTFELAYWRWGLEKAQAWRERSGLHRNEEWDAVLSRLSPLPLVAGRYLFTGNTPDTYVDPKWRRDHPSVVGALGLLPGPGVDREAMTNTFDWIWRNWNWPETWGWDYPLLAMTAARLGDPGRAVDALLMDAPKNYYRPNGHNHQRPSLTIYLPGNGGLLYAVAMMAAGWDGAPDRPAPGFPLNGSWVVRYEGLRKAP